MRIPMLYESRRDVYNLLGLDFRMGFEILISRASTVFTTNDELHPQLVDVFV